MKLYRILFALVMILLILWIENYVCHRVDKQSIMDKYFKSFVQQLMKNEKELVGEE